MTRQKFLYRLAIAMSLALPARAAVTYEETKKDGANDIEVVRMSVTPAADSASALSRSLMGRDIDLKSGNAAPFYYRALLSMPATMERVRKEFGDDFEKWYNTGADGTPIEKLPLEKVRSAVEMSSGGVIGQHLRDATSRRDCNWELNVEQLHGPEVASFMLEEFQLSRELCRAIALRARLATAEHRYDDAIDAMRMNVRLGRDVANVPLLVCGLIGIAMESIGNGTLVDFIASPDSPNLYWALTELPQPLIDLTPGARFEMDFGPRMFPFIHNAETAQHSPEEWNRLFRKTLIDLKLSVDRFAATATAPSRQTEVDAGLAATGLALIGYSHAKERLIAEGMDRNRVETMAVGQVIAIYTERTYRRLADDAEKIWYMPFPEAIKANKQLERRLQEIDVIGGGEDREILPLLRWLMPSIAALRNAQVRLEREVAALRVIEALRMYAAKHEGQLPQSLAEIDMVSIPSNPATGKPF